MESLSKTIEGQDVEEASAAAKLSDGKCAPKNPGVYSQAHTALYHVFSLCVSNNVLDAGPCFRCARDPSSSGREARRQRGEYGSRGT